jgi:hypothetical protein
MLKDYNCFPFIGIDGRNKLAIKKILEHFFIMMKNILILLWNIDKNTLVVFGIIYYICYYGITLKIQEKTMKNMF